MNLSENYSGFLLVADFTDLEAEYSGFTVPMQIVLHKGQWHGEGIVYSQAA